MHVGSKNIKTEYKSSNKEIKEVNKECDLKVLSIVLWTNKMIRNFISSKRQMFKNINPNKTS